MLTVDLMQRMWPHGNAKVPGLIEGIVRAAPMVLPKYGVAGDLVLSHAMAQFSHECGAGMEMVENINYTPARAVVIWPSRFHSADDCILKVGSYAGDPNFKIKLIDSVYGNRMGNRPGTRDGSTFIGRSLPQSTGRSAYETLSDILGVDFVADPDLVCKAIYALEVGIADFVRMCGCLPYAQKDDLNGVTKHLNGGYIGLAERAAWLRRWKAVLAEDDGLPNSVAEGIFSEPHGDAVLQLQRALIAEGFDPGAPDGMLGPKTVRAFQRSRGILPIDGKVGTKTRPQLYQALETSAHHLAA